MRTCSPRSITEWDCRPATSTTNPTPQASCSNAGSYRPLSVFICAHLWLLSQTTARLQNRMITSDACDSWMPGIASHPCVRWMDRGKVLEVLQVHEEIKARYLAGHMTFRDFRTEEFLITTEITEVTERVLHLCYLRYLCGEF